MNLKRIAALLLALCLLSLCACGAQPEPAAEPSAAPQTTTQPTTRATEGGVCADGRKCRCSRRARLKQTLLKLLKKQSEQ